MKEILTDFTGLKAFLKDSKKPFKEALFEYYLQVGEKHGFTVLKDSSVVKNAYNFGKIDMVWVEPNIAFVCEFGLLDDIYRHLWKVLVLRPNIAVLLLSGNSRCSPLKVKEIVTRTPGLEGVEFVVLDVSGGKAV